MIENKLLNHTQHLIDELKKLQRSSLALILVITMQGWQIEKLPVVLLMHVDSITAVFLL